MKEEKKIEQTTASTEKQIKEAARRVFTRKGYAATRTRDIAEESGHNLALLNYYFRSKEKLFDIIVFENLQLFIANVLEIVNDEKTTLQQKIEFLVGNYIDMLIANPDIPIFVLNAINSDPSEHIDRLAKSIRLRETFMAKQWMELVADRPNMMNPIHLFMNIMSLTIFPFLAAPIVKKKGEITDELFNQAMMQRKKLIPEWINAIFQTK